MGEPAERLNQESEEYNALESIIKYARSRGNTISMMDLNDRLPASIVTTEQIDEALYTLYFAGIELKEYNKIEKKYSKSRFRNKYWRTK